MSNPSTDTNSKRLELVKIIDNGEINNYAEFEIKSKYELDAHDLWKYIDGPESTAPAIPRLIKAKTMKGRDVNGVEHTITIPGNEDDVKRAKDDAEPWMAENKKTLALIVKAVPVAKLYLVKDCSTAKEAWNALKSEYRPSNSIRATTRKQDILGYNFQPGWNPTKWRMDMQKMYNELTDADPNTMTDNEFARHLITMMPRTGDWQYLASELAQDIHKADAQNKVLSSKWVMEKLRDEDDRQRRYNDNDREASVLMTARAEALARNKRTVHPTSANVSYSSPPKRPRYEANRQPSNFSVRPNRFSASTLFCTNEFCETPRGHTAANCISYKGGKAGQYPETWTGRRDIHLHPDERRHRRRQEMQGSVTSNKIPAVNHVGSTPGPTRANPENDFTNDEEADVNNVIPNSEDEYTFCVNIESDEVVCSATALNAETAKDNSIFHDSGATRHVFHDLSLFHSFQRLTKPIKVNGFGSTLSALAPGQGNVKLNAFFDGRQSSFTLTNALYIPSARVNLISGTSLDKKGVFAITGNGRISLSKGGKTFAEGSIHRDLYKLNVTPILPDKPVNATIDPIDVINDSCVFALTMDKEGFYTA
jgi:hypothetical protein